MKILQSRIKPSIYKRFYYTLFSLGYTIWSEMFLRFIQPYSSGLLHSDTGNLTIVPIVPVPIKPSWRTLQWRHNGRDSVSNRQPHDCLLNRLFRRSSKKTSKLRVTRRCAGNSPGPVNSSHKWPVTRKMFPFDDVIMIWVKTTVTKPQHNKTNRDPSAFSSGCTMRFLFLLLPGHWPKCKPVYGSIYVVSHTSFYVSIKYISVFRGIGNLNESDVRNELLVQKWQIKTLKKKKK